MQSSKIALSELSNLKSQLSKDSNNSHTPPSSNGFKKPPAFPRVKSGKRGGKLGYNGKKLDFVSHSDYDVCHEVQTLVCECGQCLSDVTSSMLAEKRQGFDLPPKLIEATERVRKSNSE